MNKERDKLFKILRVLSMLPTIAWPLVFVASFFFFDDPNADTFSVWIAFIIANSYPLILVGNLILADRSYKKNKILAYLILTWPIIVFALIIIAIIVSNYVL